MRHPTVASTRLSQACERLAPNRGRATVETGGDTTALPEVRRTASSARTRCAASGRSRNGFLERPIGCGCEIVRG